MSVLILNMTNEISNLKEKKTCPPLSGECWGFYPSNEECWNCRHCLLLEMDSSSLCKGICLVFWGPRTEYYGVGGECSPEASCTHTGLCTVDWIMEALQLIGRSRSLGLEISFPSPSVALCFLVALREQFSSVRPLWHAVSFGASWPCTIIMNQNMPRLR